MKNSQAFDAAMLDDAGLNRQAVFDIDAIPADLATAIAAGATSGRTYRQLILIGHAGRRLWRCIKESGIDSNDPIDDFTVRTIERWFAERQRECDYEIVYPGGANIGLQRLGQLAGWHHAAPFKVGIDREWGTWFAYRAVVLADTGFELTRAMESELVCESCMPKVCIADCPGGALEGGQFDFERCAGYRKQAGSRCKSTCLARVGCPVGSVHRYCDEQIHHSYSRSMQAIELYY